jgi:hypothetical protein
MAFNPFHAFRKYQRPLIAALAIFCMVLFVVQFGYGRADLVNQVMSMFGAGRGRGALVATLHGKKVTEGDLAKLRRDREMASKFLMVIAREGAKLKISKLLQEEGRGNDAQQPLNAAIKKIGQKWAAIIFGQARISQAEIFEQGRQDLQELRLMQSFAKNDDAGSTEELARVLAFEIWLSTPGRSNKDYYFGGNPDAAQLLDFVLWQQQADRLGIVLTEADVIAAVVREGAGQPIISGPTLAGDSFVQGFLGNNRFGNAAPDQLTQALNQEFRFVLAQEAVLGAEGGVRGVRDTVVPEMPAAGTPREFLDWYRNHRTTLKVAVLPVPVKRFVDQVKETPPESTLKALYEQYKGFEPEPSRQLPGFKEPRRVRVQMASARSDSPFYQNAALAQTLTAPAARQAAPFAAGLFGGPLGGAASAVWPLAFDPIQREYENYVADMRFWIGSNIGVGTDLTDRRPMYAGIAGLITGATPGSLLSAGTAAVAENTAYDVGLAKAAGSVLAAGAGGQPLAAIGLPFPYVTTVQPQQQVERLLLDRVIDGSRSGEGVAPGLLTKNYITFATELSKLKNRPDEAKAYVAKGVKEYGLNLHEMAQARTAYSLEDDPALRPLKEAIIAEERLASSAGQTPEVAPVVLEGNGVYEPRAYPPSRWTRVKEPFLWWRVEDLPARERPYEAVRAQVEAAWRFEKARSLAKTEADRIEAAVKKNVADNNSAAESVKVLRSFGPEFELDNVARLLPEQTPQPDFGQPYRPYSVPRDRIPYPRPDFLDRLMSLKVPGDVAVLRDKPAATFYVAVLEDRSDPTRSGARLDLKPFLSEYASAGRRGSLWQQQFMPELRRDYVRTVIKQMRIDATGGKKDQLDEEGNYILPPEVARTSDADSGE